MVPPVLTVTLNPAIDLFLEVERFAGGDLTRADRVLRAPGGKGVNVSRVLEALGVASTAVCAVGGPDGEVYLSLLADAGFEVIPIRVGGPTRTNVTISSRRPARRIKVNQPGPRLTRRQCRTIEREIGEAMARREWVVLSGGLLPGMPPETYARLTRAARRAGARVALDSEGEALRLALGARPDLVKPNREELARTLNRTCRTRRQTVEAADELRRLGAGAVVVSHGGSECLMVGEEGCRRATPPSIELQSAMGAGDSLVAGLVAGFLRGDSPEDVLRLGVACGAASAAEHDTVLARRRTVRELKREVRIDAMARSAGRRSRRRANG